jgi:LPXTG-site transpeptidase (sortase) family protein
MRRKKMGCRVVPLGLICVLAVLAGGVARAERGSHVGPAYSSPDAVRFVQNALEKDHFLERGAAAPGVLDQPTIDAIRRFQRAHFLRPTGRIDPDTMGMLASHGLAGEGPRPVAGAARSGRSTARVMPATDASPRVAGRPVPRPTYARLRLARLGIDARVVEGVDPASLASGPGHMKGTAAPGETGNCVVAGHRDGVFGRLHEVRIGDTIEMDGPAGGAVYRVGAIDVVDRADSRLLADVASSVLTLVTCHPLRYAGPAPQRLVVRADRVARRAPAGRAGPTRSGA